VSEVGKRLKNARLAKGLSLRKFARRLGEDFSVLARIEAGERYPPKARLKKFADELSFKPEQLEALIAVERRGLDPYQMLPETVPAPIPTHSIEAEVEKILAQYCRASNRAVIEGPIPVAEVIRVARGLSTEYLDFAKARITGPRGGDLYGCFFPDGFQGRDRVVLVNTGKVSGHRLSSAEQKITVAHEAGHYVLHYGNKEAKQLFFRFSNGPIYCREKEIEPAAFNLKEDQASLFAACLLMPHAQFEKAWQKAHGDKAWLAQHFDTTDSFVRLRAAMLACE
jgi:transcriptional regulator with XRE-family HTH domain